jgi:hypothetical protein
MKVTNCFHEADADKNMVFVNPAEATTAYLRIGKFVYKACPDPDVPNGSIAMNSIQRRDHGLFVGDRVNTQEFLMPMCDFTLPSLTVEVEWLRNPGNIPRPDLSQLASIFRTKFTGHIMNHGQCLLMRYIETWIHFRVKSVSYGLLTFHTEVGVEWNDSYV